MPKRFLISSDLAHGVPGRVEMKAANTRPNAPLSSHR